MHTKPVDDVIEVKISGEDLDLGKLGIKNLIRILYSIERSITSIIKKNNPDHEGNILLSLVSFKKKKDIELQFNSPKNYKLIRSAYLKFVNAIIKDDFDKLPDETKKEIKNLIDFSKETNWSILFPLGGKEGDITKIGPLSDINIPDPEFIRGETQIYAKIERIGGIKKPKVTVRLLQEKTIECDVLNTELAKKMAHRLYEWVLLTGEAVWNTDTFYINEFFIQDISEYNETPFLEALNTLSEVVESDLGKIDNVINYVNNARKE